jgi:hypothetical protein
MAEITSGNAIVDYLNKNKQKHGDVGEFLQVGEPLNVSAEVEQNMLNDAMTQAIKRTLNIPNETIKLIILERKGNAISLDCNEFLLDKVRMNFEGYHYKLNHVIIGKTGDTYAVIGYLENPGGVTQSRKPKPCTTFKLQKTKSIGATCVLLPEIIKETIFKCIKDHYEQNIPQNISDYYNPTTKEYKKQVAAENVADAQLAEAQAAAEVKEADKCDFKALLKSKIKNNESHDYCKVTDPDLLARMQQNIDENKMDVDVSGLNDLIKTRLDNLKKVKEEEEKDEDEEKEREDGKKTISEKKEATMIREANEMFVISRKVLKTISEGTTYSRGDFFNNYLKNTMVMEQEEKADENPIAEPE